MPEPASGERKQDYLKRCMADRESVDDFPRSDQRYAFCNSKWSQSLKEKKSADDRDQSRPAKPGERRKGSKKNPKGSASAASSKIKVSDATEKGLKNKVDSHNKLHGDKKGKRVTLGMLKAVYRRGAGAFSTSHRPGMTRGQWAMARVNHFLKLVRTGTPKDPKYVTDNDLLPRGHKRSTKARESAFSAGDALRKGLSAEDVGKKLSQLDLVHLKKLMPHLLRRKECLCESELQETAEYRGRKVTLNKPFRSNDGKKKFYVFVKNEKGNVIRLGFGDPNMEIRRDDPGRRKNFRARHNCDNPGPKWKARYWSCYQWRDTSKVKG
tara:strand:- start:509 stop:1480 length:972 start_codon:yes stop_codon:yes gene_type:complete